MTSNNDPRDPDFSLPSSSTIPNSNHHQKPLKKRTKKLIEIESYLVPSSVTTFGAAKKTKYSGKRPGPLAPKVTRPCSECGKEFRSWKALFGHMRCHPERQWRGINPPPNYHRSASPIQQLSTSATNAETLMTEEDREVASCLLLLANRDSATLLTKSNDCKVVAEDHCGSGGAKENVEDTNNSKMATEFGRQCSPCSGVFSSGQAVGGHKRCRWEKGKEASISSSMNQGYHFLAAKEVGGLDLNLPAPIQDKTSSSRSSGPTLDLSLGL